MIRGGFDKQIALLTASEAITFTEMVETINRTTGREVELMFVPEEEYVALAAESDTGEKPEGFFRALLSWYRAISNGEAGFTDPLMGDLLGRKPVGAGEFIEGVLQKDRDYKWHQNYAK